MAKESWIQRDSYSGKDFKIEKKTKGKRTDIFVSKAKGKGKHDHGIITPKFRKYIDRDVSKD